MSQTERRPPRKRAGLPTGPRRLDGEVLDVAGVAQLLGATEKTVRARVARQLLPHRRWGGRVVFMRAELMTFLSKLEGVSVNQALANVAGRGTGGIEPRA
ncbi:MAG: helix-turn-helix domain-containing protein [Candidatus Rokuibacteriota bacterium]